MGNEDKLRGEFVVLPARATKVGPLDAYGLPSILWADRIFRPLKTRIVIRDARYMKALLESKGWSDKLVLERASEILRDMRGLSAWCRYWYDKYREVLMRRMERLKKEEWPRFRRTVGF